MRLYEPQQLAEVVERLPGSLTSTIHAADDELDEQRHLAGLLRPVSGRLIFGGWPTGVLVSWAQHHGGPWPATNTQHTSVGTTSIRRFLRPVVWQDAPAGLLPVDVRDERSPVPRRVDGRLVLAPPSAERAVTPTADAAASTSVCGRGGSDDTLSEMTSRARTLLIGVAVVTSVLAGCDSEGDSPGAERTTASPPPLANATCVTVKHENQKLGVTVPAGFAVATPPDNAPDLADTYRVNLLSLAQRPEDYGTQPTAMLAVYGYGPGEREGQSALEASVLNFTALTGGSSQGEPITTAPTPVAGTQGSAGTKSDARALDYNPPDTMLRWWVIPTDGGLFIVAFAAVTPELDEQYTNEVLAGLTLGGC